MANEQGRKRKLAPDRPLDKPEELVELALKNLGRYEEALGCCERALQINPEFAEAWSNKGVALYFLKRYAQARQAFEKAAALGFHQAADALEVLRREGH